MEKDRQPRKEKIRSTVWWSEKYNNNETANAVSLCTYIE